MKYRKAFFGSFPFLSVLLTLSAGATGEKILTTPVSGNMGDGWLGTFALILAAIIAVTVVALLVLLLPRSRKTKPGSRDEK